MIVLVKVLNYLSTVGLLCEVAQSELSTCLLITGQSASSVFME